MLQKETYRCLKWLCFLMTMNRSITHIMGCFEDLHVVIIGYLKNRAVSVTYAIVYFNLF